MILMKRMVHSVPVLKDLNELYTNERNYDKAGLTPKERLRERQSLATKEIVIRIRSRLDSEKFMGSELQSPYYKEALYYLSRFWNELFAYLKDGEFPIRKLTTQRNNSLHYGSDGGVEMAAAYHRVIGTVELQGSSTREFIGTFFQKSLMTVGIIRT